jgi:hypothetical protein
VRRRVAVCHLDGDHIEQLFNTIAPRRNDPEFGKMGADRIDHCGLLTDEEMAGAVEHQTALLLQRLSRHKPHVGSSDRFANGPSVGLIASRHATRSKPPSQAAARNCGAVATLSAFFE